MSANERLKNFCHLGKLSSDGPWDNDGPARSLVVGDEAGNFVAEFERTRDVDFVLASRTIPSDLIEMLKEAREHLGHYWAKRGGKTVKCHEFMKNTQWVDEF